jgi:hypothetical protein
MTAQHTPRIRGVRTIGVPVTDQDPAIAFYVGTLCNGLEIVHDAPQQ